jgi:outer membrane biosynthesis protein TonB
MENTITEGDLSNMAKKEPKKPAKKTQKKGTTKTKKVTAKAKKTTAPQKKAAPKKQAAPKKKAAPKSAKAAKSFSVAAFAEMTYLTENGVMQWLKQGLLKGHQNAKGEWQIDASNLEVPNVKRLVR